jgi:lysozyme
MEISPAGIALIQSFEKCELTAYPDPAVGWKLPTIGWGHTAGVVQGQVIDQARADELLASDLAAFEAIVTCAVHVPLTQHQFDALVSIVFNVGPGNPGHRDGIIWLANGAHSTLLRTLNAGDYAGCAAEFPKWCHPANLPGILRRRLAEQAMFDGAA